MKKISIGISLFLMLVLFPIRNTFAAHGWYGPMKVVGVVAHGSVYLVDTNYYGLNDCGVAGRFSIHIDTPMAQDIYKTATIALITSRNVHIYVDASLGCILSGMLSRHILMQ